MALLAVAVSLLLSLFLPIESLVCWDSDFTEKACCSDPPLRTDCWVPERGFSKIPCCGSDGQDPLAANQQKRDNLRKFSEASVKSALSLLSGLDGCELSMLHVLNSFTDEHGANPSSWIMEDYMKTGRLRQRCLQDRLFPTRLALALLSPTLVRFGFESKDMLELYSSTAHAFWDVIRERSEKRWSLVSRTIFFAAHAGAIGPVDIAMVASVGRPAFGLKALAGIRSALFFARKRPLRFHLLVDGEGELDMQNALSTLEYWLLARGTFLFYRVDRLHRAWEQVHGLVPLGCLHFNKHYGSPGWLRLFAHEVITDDSVHVVAWVDAGDYLFLSDPAKLLEYHVQFKASHIVGFPKAHPLPFQLFDLRKMRSADWVGIVSKAFKNGYATQDRFCELGEGHTVKVLTRESDNKDLWYWFPSTWAYEPYSEWLPGYGADRDSFERRTPGSEVVWQNMPYPGLQNLVSLRVYCPDFQELFLSLVLYSSAGSDSQISMAAGASSHMHKRIWSNDSWTDSKAQELVCGEQVKGVHFVLPFHHQPWAHRFLNFWASKDVWNEAWLEGRDLRM